MKRSLFVLAALAAPAAFAQSYYVEPAPLVAPLAAPLAADHATRCYAHEDALAARQSTLEAEKRLNDREAASIARANAQLAEELRRLDPADTWAVANHNARTAEHNRRVEAHNLRVYDMNVAAREHNSEQADLQLACGTR